MPLRLQIDPSQLVQGAAQAKDALAGVGTAAGKAQSAIDVMADQGGKAWAPATAAARLFETQVGGVTQALKFDTIAFDANMRSSTAMARAYDAVNGAAGRAQDSVQDFTAIGRRGFDSMGLAAQGLGGKSFIAGGGVRMLSQQLSQVGQQAMAGGNFVQALAIQLPDIGLAFGAVGTAAGLLAGIALPLLWSALGQGEDAVKSLSDATDTLGDSISTLKGITADYANGSLDGLREKYGEVDAALLLLIQHQRDQSITAATDASKKAVSDLADEYGTLLTSIGLQSKAGLVAVQQLKGELGLSAQEGRALKAAMDDAIGATTMAGRIDALQRADAILATSTIKGGELAGAITGAALEMRAFEKAADDSAVAVATVIPDAVTLWDTLVNAADAAATLSASGPKGGWLSGAIADADNLASKLWNAATAAAVAAQAEAAQAPINQSIVLGAGGRPDGGQDTTAARGAVIRAQMAIAALANSGDGTGTGSSGAAAIDSTRDAFDQLLATLDPLVSQQQDMADAQQTINAALAAGTINAEEAANAMDLVADKFGNAADSMASFRDAGANAFDALIEGTGSVRSVIQDLIKDIGLAIVKQQLLKSVSGATAGMSIGGILMQALTGGAKDGGGMIGNGKTAMVGEYGPELVTPTAGGAMVTSRAKTAQMAAGGSLTGRIEIGVTVDDDGKIKAMVRSSSIRAAQSGAQAAIDTVRRSLGGWQDQLAMEGALT